MKRITITVRDDVAAQIEREARSRGVPPPKAASEIVTEALHMRRRKEELDENGRRIISWLGMASVGDGLDESPNNDGPLDREAAQKRQDEMDRSLGEHWMERDAVRRNRSG